MQFIEEIQWGSLDFLIIDTPSGDIQKKIAEELPLYGAILVTIPQTMAYDTLKHTITMFKETNVKLLGIIENMSYFIAPDTNKRYDIFGKHNDKTIYEKQNLNLLGQIPFDDVKIEENCKKIIEKVLEEV
jgi:ATP-binding protein involved in chromosome partitioning